MYSGGTEIQICDVHGIKIGMPTENLMEHIQKHPDVASTPDEYLEKAADILEHGRNYHEGKLYHGYFLKGYESQETHCYIVNTVHKKFPSH